MNYSKPEFVAELNVEYTQYFEQVDNMRHDSYLLNNQRMDFKKRYADNILNIALLLFIIAFPLRYIVYVTIWSIKQIKDKI